MKDTDYGCGDCTVSFSSFQDLCDHMEAGHQEGESNVDYLIEQNNQLANEDDIVILESAPILDESSSEDEITILEDADIEILEQTPNIPGDNEVVLSEEPEVQTAQNDQNDQSDLNDQNDQNVQNDQNDQNDSSSEDEEVSILEPSSIPMDVVANLIYENGTIQNLTAKEKNLELEYDDPSHGFEAQSEDETEQSKGRENNLLSENDTIEEQTQDESEEDRDEPPELGSHTDNGNDNIGIEDQNQVEQTSFSDQSKYILMEESSYIHIEKENTTPQNDIVGIEDQNQVDPEGNTQLQSTKASEYGTDEPSPTSVCYQEDTTGDSRDPNEDQESLNESPVNACLLDTTEESQDHAVYQADNNECEEISLAEAVPSTPINNSDQKKNNCPKCGQAFTKEEDMRLHLQDRPKICRMYSKVHKYLKANAEFEGKCTNCYLWFNTMLDWNRHNTQVHKMVCKLVCSFCTDQDTAKYSNMYLYLKHVFQVHVRKNTVPKNDGQKIPEKESASVPLSTFKACNTMKDSALKQNKLCLKCGQTFKEAEELTNHGETCTKPSLKQPEIDPNSENPADSESPEEPNYENPGESNLESLQEEPNSENQEAPNSKRPEEPKFEKPKEPDSNEPEEPTCPICNKSFGFQWQLFRHHRLEHDSLSYGKKEDTRKDIYLCMECEQRFESLEGLRTHEKNCSNVEEIREVSDNNEGDFDATDEIMEVSSSQATGLQEANSNHQSSEVTNATHGVTNITLLAVLVPVGKAGQSNGVTTTTTLPTIQEPEVDLQPSQNLVEILPPSPDLEVRSKPTEKEYVQNNKFPCTICDSTFESQAKLNNHIVFRNNIHSYCNKFKEVLTYLQSKNPTRQLSVFCHLCEASFITMFEQELHQIKAHNVSPYFYCQECCIHFKVKVNYVKHVHKIHIELGGASQGNIPALPAQVQSELDVSPQSKINQAIVPLLYPAQDTVEPQPILIQNNSQETITALAAQIEAQNVLEMQPSTSQQSNIQATVVSKTHKNINSPLKCDNCPAPSSWFTSASDLIRHYETVHSRQSCCSKCNLTFPTCLEMEAHWKAREPYCLQYQELMLQLARQKRDHFHCYYCNKTFGSLLVLEYHHVKLHRIVPYFWCKQCDQYFSRKLEFLKHMNEDRHGKELKRNILIKDIIKMPSKANQGAQTEANSDICGLPTKPIDTAAKQNQTNIIKYPDYAEIMKHVNTKQLWPGKSYTVLLASKGHKLQKRFRITVDTNKEVTIEPISTTNDHLKPQETTQLVEHSAPESEKATPLVEPSTEDVNVTLQGGKETPPAQELPIESFFEPSTTELVTQAQNLAVAFLKTPPLSKVAPSSELKRTNATPEVPTEPFFEPSTSQLVKQTQYLSVQSDAFLMPPPEIIPPPLKKRKLSVNDFNQLNQFKPDKSILMTDFEKEFRRLMALPDESMRRHIVDKHK